MPPPLRPALACPEKMGQHLGQDGGNAADDNHDQRIAAGIADGCVGSAQKAQQRIQKNTDQQGIDSTDANGAVNAEGTDFPCFLRFPDAHQPGEQTAAADAEQIGQRGDHHHQGQRQGGGGHHVRVACAADKESIHHVIDQVDQLADDRWNGHRQQRFRNRR